MQLENVDWWKDQLGEGYDSVVYGQYGEVRGKVRIDYGAVD